MASQNLLYMLLIYPLIYIFPAWVANGTPVIFGAGKPIDGGRKLWGKRIFGDHKTRRGLVTGIIGGIIIAGIESYFLSYMLVVGIALTIGTHVGDLFGSFVKRRLGHKEGYNFVLADSYLFLIFAFIVALPFRHLPSILGILVIVILTGILHRLTNIFAHKTRIKAVPW